MRHREFLREYALSYILDWPEESRLTLYDVPFSTVVFLSASFVRRGLVELHGIREMAEAGYTYEKDGAVWFRSSRLNGDDQGSGFYCEERRVVHLCCSGSSVPQRHSWGRGFTSCIDILGPDHHGYEGVCKLGLQASGYPRGHLEVLILQLVTLIRDGQP